MVDTRERTSPDEYARTTARPGDTQASGSPSLVVLVLIALAGVVAYAAFLFNPENRGDPLPYALVITAEVILITQALLSMWTILPGGQDQRTFTFHQARRALYSTEQVRRDAVERVPSRWALMLGGRQIAVDIFVTVYGEDIAVIERTVRAAVAMRGQHLTWVLDDGRSDEVQALAARLGAHYLRRPDNEGAKAGNVNHALSIATGEYFAIFDADFVPKPEFLQETLPFFTDSRVAFVQTPQVYGNLRTLVSRGAAFMQSVFYRFVQPGRNAFNAAFCVGTNVVFRRAATDQIGGMYTKSKSEDVWTSILLHERGWRSIYIPTPLAVGNAPESIEDYTKQQLRWATGGFEILLTHSPLDPRRKLTFDQRLQYFVTATHYLGGIVPLLLLAVPPLEIYFDLRPVNLSVTWDTWLLFYLGFYGLQILLAFNTMGSFRPETLLLASVSFPIYLRALINVLEGRDQKWHVTGARKTRALSPFNFIVPQVLTFVFLLLTSVVAIYKDVGNMTLTLATAWNVTNAIVLGIFVAAAWREERRIRTSSRIERRLERAMGRTPVRTPVAAPAPVAAPVPVPQPVPEWALSTSTTPTQQLPIPAERSAVR
jgi:cellulose synthase (UDP-forming)